MDDAKTARDELLEDIIERELAMFLATPNEGGPANCQQRPDTFRLMRAMVYSAHSNAFLKSYLNDLKQAEQTGRNFMIEKYALMDERIPDISDSPLLDAIADAENEFMEQAATERPELIQRNGANHFKHYLRAELQTLSPRTLQIYADEISAAKAARRNPALERHQWLAQKLGKQA